VALGRFTYGVTPGQLADADARAVDAALRLCDVADLDQRRITTLSGGELARVHLARALAAETPVLLADEPTAALDLAHRWTLMQVLAAQAQQDRVVLVVVHDLALAARWADRVLVMMAGRLVADGPPADVLTPALLADVFGITAKVAIDGGRPVIEVSGTVAAAAD
jgi:iron complex transport system ATP-binding protein